jgi:acyl-coenzyme A synthetase/AMP-(fatty) acid ligase
VVSVGEPINHEAWEWLHRVVGDSRCTLVDTWWQTGERVPEEESGRAWELVSSLMLRLEGLM